MSKIMNCKNACMYIYADVDVNLLLNMFTNKNSSDKLGFERATPVPAGN